MGRVVQPELLDTLPPEDSQAIRSRRDLKRINAWMGNARLMAQELQALGTMGRALRVAELGAGDGEFFLSVVGRLKVVPAQAALVDLNSQPASHVITELAGAGCSVVRVRADVFEWLHELAPGSLDVIVANLFLHHFTEEKLRELLSLSAQRCRGFVAVEPRRWKPALFCSRWVGLIGCNSVTRHDAVVSVKAGFIGREIGQLWPKTQYWRVREFEGNWASHVFVASFLPP